MPKGYRCFTDYPFTSLGDESGVEAPIRECRLLSVDLALRYCNVLVNDGSSWTEHNFKVGYLYSDRGRLGSWNHLYPIPLAVKKAYRFQLE